MTIDWSLVAGSIGAVAATFAAICAWNSPFKKDLKRVEDHTAATSAKLDSVQAKLESIGSHFENQSVKEMLRQTIENFSIAIFGSTTQGSALQLKLTIKTHIEENAAIDHIVLSNGAGNSFGKFECKELPSDNTAFYADLSAFDLRQWMNDLDAVGINKGSLVVRVGITLDESVQGTRNVPVVVVQSMAGDYSITVRGSV
ncbi:MAG TPA: hypothetical protein VG893_07415 [Terracidiphilus sp.]|nr:hypothetical protein [Terracidiphilus sp.]